MKLAIRSAEMLGTLVEVKLPEQASFLFRDCFDEFKRIEESYSRFLEDSALTNLNRNLGTWISVSDEFLWLIENAIDFQKKTDGNFDISLKAVLDGIGYGTGKQERNRQINETAPAILVDRKNSKILLNKEIDFGGFGKGYALDRVAKLLNAHRIDHYYLNAGGDIYAKKGKGEEPWTILLEHPDDSNLAIGTVEIDGFSIAGSASNRRRIGNQHHLINAKTRKPANGVKAIFITAKTGIEADAYATGLFTAGFDEAVKIAAKVPVEMLLISEEGKMYQTKGFNARIFTD